MKNLGIGSAVFLAGIGAGTVVAKTTDSSSLATETRDFACTVAGQGCEATFAMTKNKVPVSYRTVRVSFDGKIRADGNSTVIKAELPKAFESCMKDFKAGKFDALATVGQ